MGVLAPPPTVGNTMVQGLVRWVEWGVSLKDLGVGKRRKISSIIQRQSSNGTHIQKFKFLDG